MDSQEDVYFMLENPPVLCKVLKRDVMSENGLIRSVSTSGLCSGGYSFDPTKARRNYPLTGSGTAYIDELDLGRSSTCSEVKFRFNKRVGGLCISMIDHIFVYVNEIPPISGGSIYRISRANTRREEHVDGSNYEIKRVRTLHYAVLDMAISRDSSRLYLLDINHDKIYLEELIKNYNFFLFFTCVAKSVLVMDIIIGTYVFFLKLHD
jgi:hypothetical protein